VMENSIRQEKDITLLEYAGRYLNNGIITIPLNLTDGKPLLSVELLSKGEVNAKEIIEMFHCLSKDHYGIGILKDNQSGHFEGIRFKGKSDGIPAILDEIIKFQGLDILFKEKRITIIH